MLVARVNGTLLSLMRVWQTTYAEPSADTAMELLISSWASSFPSHCHFRLPSGRIANTWASRLPTKMVPSGPMTGEPKPVSPTGYVHFWTSSRGESAA